MHTYIKTKQIIKTENTATYDLLVESKNEISSFCSGLHSGKCIIVQNSSFEEGADFLKKKRGNRFLVLMQIYAYHKILLIKSFLFYWQKLYVTEKSL